MARTARTSSLLDQALAATRATRRIAFRTELDLEAPGAWCELISDVTALANSGGGVIVVGLDKTGTPTGWDPSELLAAGTGAVVDQLASYVGERLDDLELADTTKGGHRLAAVQVGARTGSPLVFEKPGRYRDADGAEREAFPRGSVYFRHGARSGPAFARDLTRFANREEARIRRDLLHNLRRVSSAPTGSQVLVVPPAAAPTTAIERVRVVTDPRAPAVAQADYDVTHPHRQTEVVRLVNARAGRGLVNSHDLLCVRRVHDVDGREEFFHKPRFGSPQYSDAFVDWLVASYTKDHSFFEAAKQEYRRRQLERRRP